MKVYLALVIALVFAGSSIAQDRPKDLSKDEQIEFFKQGHDIRLAQLQEAQARSSVLAQIMQSLLPMIGGNQSAVLDAEFQKWQQQRAGKTGCKLNPENAEWVCLKGEE